MRPPPARARRGALRAEADRRRPVARPPAQAFGRRGRPGVRGLRALVNRKAERDGVETAPFLSGAGRPLAARPGADRDCARAIGRRRGRPCHHPPDPRPEGSSMPTARPVQAQPDPDRAIPHLAMRALVSLPCGRCLPRRDRRTASRGPSAPCGRCTIPRPSRGSSRSCPRPVPQVRRDILATLVRLYHREADYDGSWWGIRPDTTGPYFDPSEWKLAVGLARSSRRPSSTATPRPRGSSAVNWPGGVSG